MIPNMLNLLPSLPYPTSGPGALLLRAGAGRLVHYTAGFLGKNGPICKLMFEFVAQSLLPSLAQCPTDDPALKASCEKAVVLGIGPLSRPAVVPMPSVRGQMLPVLLVW